MTGAGFAMRLIALTRKETRQMLRDRSNLIVGLFLPAILILLFGYGLSFDVTDARIAVVMEADHFCMQWRGVKDMDSKMVNSVMRGVFLTDANLRRELLALVNQKRGA